MLGRTYAMSPQAAACKPGVFENKSKTNPIKKPKKVMVNLLVPKGIHKMNKKYK
jgi:hypothetical protein